MQIAASIAAPTRVAHPTQARYARCIEISKRVRWEIERDVIRDRRFDPRDSFLPVGLTFVDRLDFLGSADRRFVSQIQGRTYANMFSLVERYVTVKILDLARAHGVAEPVALEALVRFGDEELKHQELFRRIERMAAAGMPEGYTFLPEPNAVASAVLGKSTWAVLALICHIELFVLAHYRESIDPDPSLSALWKDVFLYHWREESQHAILDELEWTRENARVTPAQRDRAVNELIELVAAIDAILQDQSAADADYFMRICGRTFGHNHTEQVRAGVLHAYRWQYIVSGVQGRFGELLGRYITPGQQERIGKALAPILG